MRARTHPLPPPVRRRPIQCRRYLEQDPIFVDTETTGVCGDSEIVEIGAVSSSGNVLLDVLVRPQGELNERAMRVSGITLQDLFRAKTWLELWPDVRSVLASSPSIGAFNAPFDRRMLRQTNERFGIDLAQQPDDHAWFCLMQWFSRASHERTKTGRLRRYSLAAALALAQENGLVADEWCVS